LREKTESFLNKNILHGSRFLAFLPVKQAENHDYSFKNRDSPSGYVFSSVCNKDHF